MGLFSTNFGEAWRMAQGADASEKVLSLMSAYVRKMALDGICIRLDLQDVRQLVSMLQRCTNNLNQYAKRSNETGSIYAADIEDLQKRLDEIWELSRQTLASLAAIR